MAIDLKQHIQRAEKGKASRGNWENTFQIIKDYVRPSSEEFNRHGTDGEILSNKVLDDTAIQGAEDLGNLIVSNMMPSNRRGFCLTVGDKSFLEQDDEAKLWLEDASDLIFHIYSLPTSNHAQVLHEDMLDICSFGTGIMYQDEDLDTFRPVFKTFPLADCVIYENWLSRVDTLYRWVEISTRQAMQQFGNKKKASLPSKVLTEKDPDKIWKFMHMTFPRSERDSTKLTPENMKFASIWTCLDDKEHGTVEDSGYHEFPYHVSRWSKRTGEVYGRSPAWNCLPSILMLNKMCETTIISALKQVDPILMVPDDGFLGTPKTYPGALNVYEAGTQDRIEPLETKGRVDLGLEMEDRRRQIILRAFFNDLSKLEKNNVEMTAYEAQVRQTDRFKAMGPMLFRVMAELLSPKIARTYNMLLRRGWFRPPPASLRGKKVLIEYISPAAKALQQGDASSIDMLLQSGAVIANIKPEVMDHFDLDIAMKIKANALGVPQKIIRPDKDVAEIRAKRQEQEQMQQMIAAAPQVSKAIKDVSTGQAAVTTANAKAA